MTRRVISGFTEIATRNVPEIATHTRHFRHDRTGADAVFLLNADAAKTFAIAFRTQPSDSTGIAHILEHCVLSGSRAYPTAKPFLDLLKGSLQSHLNASTFADFTIYLAASPHPRDFANLVDVYLDAVFFPLLTEESFRREGWHMSAEGTPQGIVLNEMKGFHASSDDRLAECARRSLFRTGVFRHAHGGLPERITDLTPDVIRRFHTAFYHPSNTLAAYCGVEDIPRELRKLDRVFAHFERRLAILPPFGAVITAPRAQTSCHAGSGSARLALSWAFDAPEDRLAELALEVMCEAVAGQPFAPLRRALIEGCHCREVADARFHDDTSPPRFAIRLGGVDPLRVAHAEAAVHATLERLARVGIDGQSLRAALNTVEFRCRDRSTSKRPQAVALLLETAKSWRLGHDPIDRLGSALEIAELRRKPKTFFTDLARAQLLENPRRTRILLKPEPEPKTALPSRTFSNAIADAAVLAARPSGAGGVPHLALRDLPRLPAERPMSIEHAGGVRVLFLPRQTNGVIHVDLAFDLAGLASPSCAALFGQVLLQAATTRRDAEAMSHLIGTETGGLSAQVSSAPRTDGTGAASCLILRARVLADRTPQLFDILGELLGEAILPDPLRLTEMVSAEIARIRGAILSRAHEFLDWRLRDHVDDRDQTAGLGYLAFLRDYRTLLHTDLERALRDLEDIQATILCRARLVIAVTGNDQNGADLRARVKWLAAHLPKGHASAAAGVSSRGAPSEAFVVPGEVNFVAMALEAPNGAAPAASFAVALRCLETDWLWQKLREEGGAYGALCRTDPRSRVSTLLSYRDPHVLRTLDVFAAAGGHLTKEVSGSDLTNAVISVIGALDRPLSPADCALAALTDWLTGWSDAHRKSFRAQVLETNAYDLKNVGNALSRAEKPAHIALFGGREALAHALTERPGLFEINNLPGER